MKQVLGLMLAAVMLAVCGCSQRVVTVYTERDFGTLPDGQKVKAYTITDSSGLQLEVLNYGGIVRSLKVPQKDGTLRDVVVGFNTLEDYLKYTDYFGALIGRYGNRIGKGKFAIDGTEYQLDTNNGANTLHGGKQGWNSKLWDVSFVSEGAKQGLKLTLVSPDGDMGFPGEAKATVHYWVSKGVWRIEYSAVTDKPTLMNLTQHTYFNVKGEASESIEKHTLQILADSYTPVDKALIPTGTIDPVKGTPFDFTEPMLIGKRIGEDNEQLKFGRGYDHNWCLRNQSGELAKAAVVAADDLAMEVWTTEPGLQVYTGNGMNDKIPGKLKGNFKRAGICLETQHYPDSPNQPAFPSTILRPGTEYRSITEYRFRAVK